METGCLVNGIVQIGIPVSKSPQFAAAIIVEFSSESLQRMNHLESRTLTKLRESSAQIAIDLVQVVRSFSVWWPTLLRTEH